MAKTSKEALQKLRKEEKQKARRKGKITQLNAKFQRIVRRDKKAFLSVQCKEIEENNRIGTTRNLFKKLDRAREHFIAKIGTIKDKNGKDLQKQKRLIKGGKNTRKMV